MRRRGDHRTCGFPSRPVSPYRALASDGDGTLLRRKWLARRTAAALERLKASGRKLILATGETHKDLANFPHGRLFDLVVTENGAGLYRPEDRRVTRLAEPPPPDFVRELRKRGVKPASVGQVIVSVRHPEELVLEDVIRGHGMDWRLVRNRKQLMALPAGVDKATGLAKAVKELGLSACEVVGVGDAENDLPLLRFCGCGVAVASGVPLLREHADLVTSGGAGEGVVELVNRLIAGDLPAPVRRKRQRLPAETAGCLA